MSANEAKNRGNIDLKSGRYESALKHYDEAVKLEPDNAVHYSNRCLCLIKLQENLKAVKDGRKCIALKGNWPRGYQRTAQALLALDRAEEADNLLQEALTKVTDKNDKAFQASVKAVKRALKVKAKKKAKKAKTLQGAQQNASSSDEKTSTTSAPVQRKAAPVVVSNLDEINDLSAIKATVAKPEHKYCVACFYNATNPKSRRLMPEVDLLSKKEEHVKFFRVNTSLAEDAMNKYDIMSLPTFILFAGGKKHLIQQGSTIAALEAAIAKMKAQ